MEILRIAKRVRPCLEGPGPGHAPAVRGPHDHPTFFAGPLGSVEDNVVADVVPLKGDRAGRRLLRIGPCREGRVFVPKVFSRFEGRGLQGEGLRIAVAGVGPVRFPVKAEGRGEDGAGDSIGAWTSGAASPDAAG